MKEEPEKQRGQKSDMEWKQSRLCLASVVGIFVVLIHGPKLHSAVIGIDTEDIIRLQGHFYGGWLNSGRYGLVLMKKIMNTYQFSPFFAGAVTLVFLWLAVMAFLHLWRFAGENEGQGTVRYKRQNAVQLLKQGTTQCEEQEGSYILASLMGAGLMVSHPVLTEQFYFSLQSMEICIGFCLTALAVRISVNGIRERNPWKKLEGYLICIPVLVLLFSVYQIMTVVYVAGVLSTLVILYDRELSVNPAGRCGSTMGQTDTESGIDKSSRCKELERPSCKGTVIIRECVGHSLLFLISFIVNCLINRRFSPSGSSYIRNQIMWDRVSVREGILRILDHIFRVLTGTGSLYYNISFGILCIGIIILALLRRAGGDGSRTAKAVWFLLVFCLLSTPFWMTLLCGGAPVVRSQLVLPILTGLLGYLAVCWTREERASDKGMRDGGMPEERIPEEKVKEERTPFRKHQKSVWLVCAVCIWGIWTQAQTTLGLYYTDACRYEQDVFMGRSLIERMEQVAQNEKMGTEPVGYDLSGYDLCIVGTRPFLPNHACLTGETTGKSFFDYDKDVEPPCYWSTRRVVGFLHTLGCNIGHASMETTARMRSLAETMPIWPAEGSVLLDGHTLVVRLS